MSISSDGPFRLGLIGAGRMGQTHLRALADSDSVVITAVAEPHQPTAAALRARGVTVVSSVAELLDAGGVDGVLICVPTDRHLATIREVAPSGLAILCEKPCGVVTTQTRQIRDIVAEAGVLLQVGYWRRFVPALVELRSVITSGAAGTVHGLLCAQWDESPPPTAFRAHSGGIFIDMGVHEIDQARWLTGSDMVAVSALAGPVDPHVDPTTDVDSAHAIMAMADGTSVVVGLGRFHPGGDVVSVEMWASMEHRRFDVVSPATGEAPQLAALRAQAEAFAASARDGIMRGASIDDAIRAIELAEQLSSAIGIRVGEPDLRE